MEDKAMSNLFEKITKGSILLWHVNDEGELPKRKEIAQQWPRLFEQHIPEF